MSRSVAPAPAPSPPAPPLPAPSPRALQAPWPALPAVPDVVCRPRSRAVPDPVPPLPMATPAEAAALRGGVAAPVLAEILLATSALAQPLSAERIARYRAQLEHLPTPFAVLHRRDRRAFYRHAVEVVDHRSPPPAAAGEARERHLAGLTAALRHATAVGWAWLEAARDATPGRDGALLGATGPLVATPKGWYLGGTFAEETGDWQRISALLTRGYQWCQVRGSPCLPWLHWVGTYKRDVTPAQMRYDAQAVMTGVGVLPRAHPWALFGHGTHWHLVASRVRWDGRTLDTAHLGVAARLTVDVLDAEAGFASPFHVPAGDGRAFPALRRGSLATIWRGRPGDPAEATTVPQQGPDWAARLADLGRFPQRVPGLLVLPKPSYVDCAGIVRHCLVGE